MERKNLKLYLICFLIVLSSTLVIADNWIIDGDRVYVDDENVYISASPNTIYISSQDEVFFNVTSKVYSGDVDIVFGFDTSVIKPIKAELYKPEWITETMSYTCDTDYFNYTTSPKYAWCYDYVYNNETYELEVIFEHEFDYGNLGEKTIYWNETYFQEWKDYSSSFSSVNYDYGGMTKWYYVKNVPIQEDTEYVFKGTLEIDDYLETSGKYWFAIKPSSETISQAVSSGHLYALDPFWTQISPNSYQDNFTYADSSNLSTSGNWTELFDVSTTGVDAYFKDYQLVLEDNHAGNNVRAQYLDIHNALNYSHPELEINFSFERVTFTQDGMENLFSNYDAGGWFFKWGVRQNNSNTSQTVFTVSGFEVMEVQPSTFYNVLFKFDWLNNLTEVYVDGDFIINKTFLANSTRFGGKVQILTGAVANQGNITLDYIQWGSEATPPDDTSFTVSLPSETSTIDFLPTNKSSKFVTPENQTAEIGIFYITNTGNIAQNFSLHFTTTSPSWVVTFADDSSTFTDGIILNTTYQKLVELPVGNSSYIWLWSNFSDAPHETNTTSVEITSNSSVF